MQFIPHTPKHRLAAYIVGFITCLALTIIAYTLAVNYESLSRNFVIGSIAGLAILQFFTQLVFFLHVGVEPKAKWKNISFIFMLIVVFILVGGSLWIMYNLNYHMDSHQMQEYLQDQDSL